MLMWLRSGGGATRAHGCLGGDGGGAGWGHVLMHGEKSHGSLQDLNLGDKLSHRLLAHPDLSHGLLSHIFLSSTEPVAYLGKSPRCPHSGEAFCICY